VQEGCYGDKVVIMLGFYSDDISMINDFNQVFTNIASQEKMTEKEVGAGTNYEPS